MISPSRSFEPSLTLKKLIRPATFAETDAFVRATT
jgi:hypothetical protein